MPSKKQDILTEEQNTSAETEINDNPELDQMLSDGAQTEMKSEESLSPSDSSGSLQTSEASSDQTESESSKKPRRNSRCTGLGGTVW